MDDLKDSKLLVNEVPRILSSELINKDIITLIQNSFSNDCRFWVGDIESGLDENEQWFFKLISISDGVYIKVFNDLLECFEYLNENSARIYFHNLDFDLLFFLKDERISQHIENAELIASGNLTLTTNILNVTFLNSLSLIPLSLKKIVTKFLKVNDEDYLKDKENVINLDNEQLADYCNKDVIYLYAALIKFRNFFIEKYNMELTLTTPSLAFKLFIKHFLKDKDFIHISKRHNFFESGYYYGGHTEKFIDDRNVFRNVYYYDVNSLYPFIMRDVTYINSKLKRIKPNISNMKRLIKQERLFYCECMINIDSEELRAFPILDVKEKVNLYPLGWHKLKLSEVGIKFILKWGSWANIIDINTLLIGVENKTISPFTDFVNVFYEMRKSDKSNDITIKLLLNSLYGKFGEKLKKDLKVINKTIEDDEIPKMIKTMKEGKVVIETFERETPFYNHYRNRLDIAGKITETARIHMMNLINEIRRLGCVIYTDTDSIITNVDLTKTKLSFLLDDKELGKLADEIGYKDNAIILGQKQYHFYKSGKKATKGVKNLTLKDFKDIIRGRETFQNRRFSKLHALVDKGIHGIQIVPYTMRGIRQRLDK